MVDDMIVLADGRRLAFIDAGAPAGTPVLHFHGAPTCRFEVLGRPQDEAAAGGVRLVAVDRPGYGGSDPRPGRGIEDWPLDVAAVADALGIDRFAVVGVSSGGPYAVAAAALLPGRVTAAGVLSGVGDMGQPGADQGYLPGELELMQLGSTDPDALHARLDALAAALRADPQATITELFGGLPPEPRRTRVVHIMTEAFRQGGVGYAEDLLAQAQPWRFDPGSITAPLLVWHGDADEMVPLHHPQHTAAVVPTAQLRLFPGEGHLDVASRAGEAAVALANLAAGDGRAGGDRASGD
jgi:pimeloyl-ACP methyl ester carboxylesterase